MAEPAAPSEMTKPKEPVEPSRPAVGERRGAWGLAAALVLLALVLVLVVQRQAPPAPKGADAPAAEFSAARAGQVLRTLAGDESPRPVGSAAHARAREAIVAELRRLGLRPEVQEGTACNARGTCGTMRNVVARMEGGEPGRAVLLVSHYDSVAAGPGIGDDLSGVAVMLEVARALQAGPPPASPVLFLFTDGEEMGLLGAELFAEEHPAAGEVGAVVNLEARGTSGPSLMFETIGDDAWMVARYAARAPRPITSSLYPTIYEILPNDTDLSVFRRRGYQGMNFAFIRGPRHYHTTADNLANLSPASLQHQGDNALAAVRGLAQADLDAPPPAGDAVFFDVLGFGVVRWPRGLSPVLAGLALLLVAAAAFLAVRRREVRALGVLLGVLAFLGALVAALLLGYGLQMLLRGAWAGPWVDRPQADIAAFWLAALAAVTGVAALLSRRAGAAGLWAGTWIAWAALGLAAALAMPGISYLLLVPALAAGLAGLFTRGPAASLVPAVLAGVLWFPILTLLYDGLGGPMLFGVGLLVALVLTSLMPLVPMSGALGRRIVPVAALVLALASVGVAYASAPFSEETPQPVSLELYQDAEAGEAYWLVRGGQPLPPALGEAADFQPAEHPYPWVGSEARAVTAPAPRQEIPGPRLTVLEDAVLEGGGRRLRLLLASERQAPSGAVVIPREAGLRSLRVAGEEVDLGGAAGKSERVPPPRPWRPVEIVGLPPEGAEIEVVLENTQPLDWYVRDRSAGLPAAGEALLRARSGAAGVRFQDGDVTSVSRKVRI